MGLERGEPREERGEREATDTDWRQRQQQRGEIVCSKGQRERKQKKVRKRGARTYRIFI